MKRSDLNQARTISFSPNQNVREKYIGDVHVKNDWADPIKE